MAAFYDNSPGMVDDLTPASGPPAAPAAPAPAAPPAAATPPASNIADMSAPPAPPPADAAEIKARTALVDTLAAQADALPHGSEVAVHLGRAAEAAGLAGDEAAAVVNEWSATFKAHGVSASDAMDLTTIGARIQREGIPDEATEAGWVSDAAIAASIAQSREFWSLREHMTEAQQRAGKNIKHDIALPVSRPTSCMFGGPDLRTLFVTTSREKRPADELAAQPLAGWKLIAQGGVQATGFSAKHQPVARLKRRVVHAARAARGQGKHAGGVGLGIAQERSPVAVFDDLGVLVIVQPGPA